MSVIAETEHARSEQLDNPESIYRACADMKLFSQEVLRVILLDTRYRQEGGRGQPLTYDLGWRGRRVSRPPRIEFAGAVRHGILNAHTPADQPINTGDHSARGERREENFRDDRDRSKVRAAWLKAGRTDLLVHLPRPRKL
jgi:hypothetical protein